ncbi:hypothetical protein [Haladaptatus sp. DYSN1]|uniref:hypothetical protein n=1 Tax=unclassified Haladaptatus TaxID=2622732 RepID=UPI00240603C5|nr:hypothetical protein [Haladaptatus sp. DYSN1]
MVYITRGLATVLLEYAAEAAPEGVTFALSVSPAGELEGHTKLDPETPVFTHFYLADAGKSVSAVFGVDLGTPAGQTQGRFVSHPDGFDELAITDDLHGTVFVATPPWDEDGLRAFDRSGVEQSLTVLDAEPPEDVLA